METALHTDTHMHTNGYTHVQIHGYTWVEQHKNGSRRVQRQYPRTHEYTRGHRHIQTETHTHTYSKTTEFTSETCAFSIA
jgi:hypothetical protein